MSAARGRGAWRLGPAVLLGVGLAAAPAAGDRVTTKGVTLEGAVKRFGSEHLVFETIYGKGSLEIPLAEIESLETDGRFYVFYGEGGEGEGRFFGLEDGVLRFGESAEAATPLEVTELHSALSEKRYQESWGERLRSRYRFWSVRFDLDFSTERSTTDTLNLATGLRLERKKAPTRLLFRASYKLETERSESDERNPATGEPRNTKTSRTLANEIYGLIRGDYDLDERWFTFASLDGKYDEIEEVSLRSVAQSGLGYRLIRSERAELSVRSGGGWVYERFFGGERNDYPTVVFGAESKLDLRFATWESAVQYTPSLTDWENDYLLRAETALQMPLMEFVAFRLALTNDYDSTPAEGTERNTFSAILGLSFGF